MEAKVAKFKIGGVKFKSKKAAQQSIRAVLYSYAPGETLSRNHAAFILDLLDLHPESDLKVGCGVKLFTVQRNHPYNSVGFWIQRVDGSVTDFSYISCLSPPTPRKEVLSAMREEIHGQIREYRQASQETHCAITGEPINPDNSHVDHTIPFIELAEAFSVEDGTPLDDMSINETADGDVLTRLKDRDLAKRWQDYHREHARLRMVTATANLSRPRR
jgi:hypothetical protein